MFHFGLSNHTRNYPFRPPRFFRGEIGSDWALYWRFIKQYVWPSRWSLLLCIFLVSANSLSGYLMSFYSRLVVDEILVIKPDAAPSDDASTKSIFGNALERPVHEMSAQRVSMGRSMDNGIVISKRPPGAGRRLLFIAFCYVGTQILLNFLVRLSTRQQIAVSQAIAGTMREDMHKKVLQLSLAYHQTMSPGRLVSRILSDVGTVKDEIMGFFLSATHCISMMIGGTVILLVNAPQLAMIALITTPIYAWMYKKKKPLIRRLNQEARHTNACLYGLVSQKLEGMKVIQAYARETAEILNFHRLTACYMRDSMDTHKISALLDRKANILSTLSNCAIFLYGGKLVLDGEMQLGQMLFIHSTTGTLFQPAIEFTRLSFVLQRLQVGLMRIAGVLDKEIDIKESPNAVDFPSPIKKGIAINHISFSYPASLTDKEADGIESTDAANLMPPVIKDVDLFVPAGEWLCIMGASGAGKTTLLHLLSRLYEPTTGHITVDGIDLKDIKMLSMRHAIGVVPQEAQIFSGSMRDNICYGLPDATNKQIMDAAKAAQLHDFIMGMKVQYETLIGQRGTSLSGGQRQRLSLARALLTNPELLILDDCTSALDAATEQKIQETLIKILQGKTAIMVSQRVSMAMRCHKIAVIDNGVITEYGTHRQLLERHGFYAKLFSQQTE